MDDGYFQIVCWNGHLRVDPDGSSAGHCPKCSTKTAWARFISLDEPTPTLADTAKQVAFEVGVTLAS